MAAKTATGKYKVRIQVLARQLAAAGANGERAESWPASGPAYSAARDALSAGETIAAGVSQGTGTAKLRVKGRSIPVADVDRVKVVATGEVYNVTGVYREAADTVITIVRAPAQTVPQ